MSLKVAKNEKNSDAPDTVRRDPNPGHQLAHVARRKGISNSEVIRRALNSWPEFADSAVSPYEQLADLIGVVQGGNPRRSEKSGMQLRKILAAKRNRS